MLGSGGAWAFVRRAAAAAARGGQANQEELAEAASLSSRSVIDLERGITRTAHKRRRFTG
jgi:hypothetical protein